MTIAFVAACVLIFLWQISLGPARGEQAIYAMTPAGEGGVAFRAHIGGFIAGMLLIPLFKQRRFRLRTPWAKNRGQ